MPGGNETPSHIPLHPLPTCQEIPAIPWSLTSPHTHSSKAYVWPPSSALRDLLTERPLPSPTSSCCSASLITTSHISGFGVARPLSMDQKSRCMHLLSQMFLAQQVTGSTLTCRGEKVLVQRAPASRLKLIKAGTTCPPPARPRPPQAPPRLQAPPTARSS